MKRQGEAHSGRSSEVSEDLRAAPAFHALVGSLLLGVREENPGGGRRRMDGRATVINGQPTLVYISQTTHGSQYDESITFYKPGTGQGTDTVVCAYAATSVDERVFKYDGPDPNAKGWLFDNGLGSGDRLVDVSGVEALTAVLTTRR